MSTSRRPVLRACLSIALGALALLPVAAAPALASDGVAVDDTGLSTPADEDLAIAVLANDHADDIPAGSWLDLPSSSSVHGADLWVDGDRIVYHRAEGTGSDSFTYQVRDPDTSDVIGTATVTVRVTAAKVLSARADDLDVEKDTPTTLAVTDNDKTGDAVRLEPTAAPAHGTLSVNPDDYSPTITFTPETGYTGEDSFGYRLVDAAGHQDTATVTVHVRQIGVRNLDHRRTWDGAHVSWDLPRSTNFDGVVVRLATGTPGDDYVAPPATVDDGLGVSVGDRDTSVDLTGLAMGTPYAVSVFALYDGRQTVTEPESRSLTPGLEPVTGLRVDAGNQTATLAWTNPPHSSGTTVAWTTPAGADASVVVAAGQATRRITGLTNGNAYTFTVTSTAAGSGDAFVGEPRSIDTTPRSTTDHAPVAAADVVSVIGAAPVTFNVLDNDSDTDDDALTVLSQTDPSAGRLACDDGGTCTYTPDAADSATDTFGYTVSDGHGGRATGVVHLVRRGVVTHDDTMHATSSAISTSDVLANDTGLLPTDNLVVDANHDPAGSVDVDFESHPVLQFTPASMATRPARPAGGSGSRSLLAVTPPTFDVTYRILDESGTRELAHGVLHVHVAIAPQVTAAANHTSSAVTAPVTISGKAAPVDAGEPVRLERQAADGTWGRVAATTFATGATGTDAATGAPYAFRVAPDEQRVAVLPGRRAGLRRPGGHHHRDPAAERLPGRPRNGAQDRRRVRHAHQHRPDRGPAQVLDRHHEGRQGARAARRAAGSRPVGAGAPGQRAHHAHRHVPAAGVVVRQHPRPAAAARPLRLAAQHEELLSREVRRDLLVDELLEHGQRGRQPVALLVVQLGEPLPQCLHPCLAAGQDDVLPGVGAPRRSPRGRPRGPVYDGRGRAPPARRRSGSSTGPDAFGRRQRAQPQRTPLRQRGQGGQRAVADRRARRASRRSARLSRPSTR